MTAATALDTDSRLNEQDSIQTDSKHLHVLEAESELRVEASPKSSVFLTLQRGSCELFGVELTLNKEYEFDKDSKLALFTWHGCVLDVRSDEEDGLLVYVCESDETTYNVAYVNTHAQLEAMRDTALQKQAQGPRVLVVGAADSGKSSLCRVLLAYATKLGRTPLYVDLDPADNGISIPGTLAVAPITAVGLPTTTSSIAVEAPMPLVLWHGSTTVAPANKTLWEAQVSGLGQKIDQRLESDTDASKASGIICNTNGWIQGGGYDMLLHAVQALRINVILILGNDRLYSLLHSSYHPDKQESTMPKVIKLPSSGGVVARDSNARRQIKSHAIKQYFYGDRTRSSKLTPFLAHVPISKITIYKYASLALSASLLPVSAKQSTEPVQLVPVEVSDKLQHTVLAVCHPHAVQAYNESGMARDLYTSGVAGFVVVERVLMEADILHLLSPCAGSLPSDVLILGDNVTWME